MSGIAPSPPGTAPAPEDPDVAAPGAAAGDADDPAETDGSMDADGVTDAEGATDATGVTAGPATATGSTGSASGTSNGASSSPPGVAVNDAVRDRRAVLRT